VKENRGGRKGQQAGNIFLVKKRKEKEIKGDREVFVCVCVCVCGDGVSEQYWDSHQ
jgi:hypothetical protein